jgi:hypothetical protein
MADKIKAVETFDKAKLKPTKTEVKDHLPTADDIKAEKK